MVPRNAKNATRHAYTWYQWSSRQILINLIPKLSPASPLADQNNSLVKSRAKSWPSPNLFQFRGSLPCRPTMFFLQPVQNAQQSSLFHGIREILSTDGDRHVRLHHDWLRRWTRHGRATQTDHNIVHFINQPPLGGDHARPDSRDVGIIHRQQDPGEVQKHHPRHMHFGHVPDVRETFSFRTVGVLVVDRGERQRLDLVPVDLELTQLIPPLDLSPARNVVGAETILEDIGAVVQMPVGPDKVFSLVVPLENRPRVQWQPDGALLEKRRGGFLPEGDSKGGVLEALEVRNGIVPNHARGRPWSQIFRILPVLQETGVRI